MKISEKGLDLIKQFEGFSAKPYLDVALVPTIGYGLTHYIDGRKVTMDDHEMTKETATYMLENQVDKLYGQAVSAYATGETTQNQFDALTSFAYNLGTGALRGSTLLRKHNAGKNDEAANEFGKWIHAGGRVIKGLVARREKEKELYLS